MQNLFPHMRMLPQLTSPSLGKAWLAWHGILISEGVHAPYHRCYTLDPIYLAKKSYLPL